MKAVNGTSSIAARIATVAKLDPVGRESTERALSPKTKNKMFNKSNEAKSDYFLCEMTSNIYVQ